MADRSNHYERAFESYLRRLAVPCIPVVETRRALVEETTLKSLDFVVLPKGDRVLLVDVKGRRIRSPRGALECWATEDDVRSLERWREEFGGSAEPLLVFVYELPIESPPDRFSHCFEHGERRYAALAVPLSDYRRTMRVRSPRWKTVCMPSAEFRRLARPIGDWLTPPCAA